MAVAGPSFLSKSQLYPNHDPNPNPPLPLPLTLTLPLPLTLPRGGRDGPGLRPSTGAAQQESQGITRVVTRGRVRVRVKVRVRVRVRVRVSTGATEQGRRGIIAAQEPC